MEKTKREVRKSIKKYPHTTISNQKVLEIGIRNKDFWNKQRKEKKIFFFKDQRGAVHYLKADILLWVEKNYRSKKNSIWKMIRDFLF